MRKACLKHLISNNSPASVGLNSAKMKNQDRAAFKKILEAQAKALGFTYRKDYDDYRLKQVQYDFSFELDAFDHVRAHVFDRKGKAVGIQIHIRDFNASKTMEILKQTIQRL